MNTRVRITEQLATEPVLQHWLWVPLVRLLSAGSPVTVAGLAAAVGRGEDEVRTALATVPDVEYDGESRIVGWGLTLRPTQHRFEVGGTQLYTWCALDTLILPAVLGRAAVIESAHPGGEPVRLTVEPSGLTGTLPATAVASLVEPGDLTSVRSSFCSQVHFFASDEEAGPWLEAHPGGAVVPVAEAHRTASRMAARMLDETAASVD